MFVVHAHPVYQRRSRRVPSYDPFGFERPVYSLSPEPTLGDPVQLARARYLHALEEQQAARDAYAAHQLHAFQDEAAAFLQYQQQRRRQAAIEEARLRAERARREQLIQARREEQLRRRRLQDIQEHEFGQALMLAFELASQVEPSPVGHAPAHPECAYAHGYARRTARPTTAAPTPVASVPIGHAAAPSCPVPPFQPRVRFSPQESSARAPVAAPSKPAATPVTLKSALKPTAPPAPIRIGVREPQAGPSSSSSASAPAPPAATVRIPIRESKGKASSQVRINAVSTPAPYSLTPADAIAALSLLEADLDALTPSTTSVPLLRHQLNGILESVDAIESGGHDAVREVRRALVRRIEEALVAVEQGDAVPALPQRAVGITINEPSSTRVEVRAPAHSVPATSKVPLVSDPVLVKDNFDVPSSPAHATPPTTADVAPVLEGYVVDDFLDATPANPSSSSPSSPSAAVDELAVPKPAEPAPVADSGPDVSVTAEADQAIATADELPVARADDPEVHAVSAHEAADAAANDDLISFDAASSSDGSVSFPSSPASGDDASLPATSSESASPPDAAVESAGSPPAAVAAELDTLPAESTAPTAAYSIKPASPTPDETPLTASYPPAQTFAAPSHPAVDNGSDGEWERPGSSEGEKSDYEVL